MSTVSAGVPASAGEPLPSSHCVVGWPTLGWLQRRDRSAGRGPGRVRRIVTPVTTARLYVAVSACTRWLPLRPPDESAAGYPAQNASRQRPGSGQRTSVYWLGSSCTTSV